jgi:DMSO reductase family type II enzyme heme b subunit
MKAAYLAGKKLADFIETDSPLWSQTVAAKFPLTAAPLAMQPTEGVKAQWQGRPYGLIKQVQIAALHNGEHLAIRLEWASPNANQKINDNDQFVDAAGIMFPSVSGAPLLLMGSAQAPVDICYWRADQAQRGQIIVAHGIGTSNSVDKLTAVCRAKHNEGRWQLVIARPLSINSQHPQAQLRVGEKTPYGVAIWEGGNQERAGIKSIGISTEDLLLEAIG